MKSFWEGFQGVVGDLVKVNFWILVLVAVYLFFLPILFVVLDMSGVTFKNGSETINALYRSGFGTVNIFFGVGLGLSVIDWLTDNSLENRVKVWRTLTLMVFLFLIIQASWGIVTYGLQGMELLVDLTK